MAIRAPDGANNDNGRDKEAEGVNCSNSTSWLLQVEMSPGRIFKYAEPVFVLKAELRSRSIFHSCIRLSSTLSTLSPDTLCNSSSAIDSTVNSHHETVPEAIIVPQYFLCDNLLRASCEDEWICKWWPVQSWQKHILWFTGIHLERTRIKTDGRLWNIEGQNENIS